MNRLKQLRILGMISMVFWVVFLHLGITHLVVFIGTLLELSLFVELNVVFSYALNLSTFIGVVCGLLSLFISFIGSIVVLSTDFKNQKVNESKILWGLLSLFFLGSIGIFVFISKSSKEFDDIYSGSDNDVKLKNANKKSALKKLMVFKLMGIFSLILVIVAISLIVASIVISYFSPHIPYDVLFFVGWIILVVSLFVSVISSALILGLSFENKQIDELKILWGVLSLLFLGPIGIIIFSVKGSKIANIVDKVQSEPSIEVSDSDQKILRDVSGVFRMFDGLAVSQEEYDRAKENNFQ